jgi:hypothetical protein
VPRLLRRLLALLLAKVLARLLVSARLLRLLLARLLARVLVRLLAWLLALRRCLDLQAVGPRRWPPPGALGPAFEALQPAARRRAAAAA